MSPKSQSGLSHVGPDGAARMVDVSEKPDTPRMARATGQIVMAPATLEAIADNRLAKGDVLAVARIAGIMAAKRTADLIPLCHPLPLTDVAISFLTDPSLPGVRAEAVARTIGKTGVEMEALTAVSVALLTIYDMVKALDKGMVLGDISLAQKTGGAGGDFARLAGSDPAR
jgi:cyclic pyranopterin phosphate synthase